VEGDHTSPTQPFSVGMPNFAGPVLTAKDMWGLTPIDQLMCLLQFQGSNYVGQYTPPSVKPWIAYPGYVGGIDWGGVAVDTSRNIVVVNSQRVANRDWLIPRATVERLGVTTLGDPGVDKPYYGPSPQKGTPYGVVARPWISPVGLPCQQPPWGFLTAIDLTTQKVIWTQTFGTAYDNGPFGTRLHIPAPAGVPNQGGAVVTSSGLTFIAATMDAFIRAFDTQTGAELWRSRLPAGGQANPMTYEVDGRQYVLITAGGHMLMGTPQGDAIIAYALPETHASQP
jgi:quinoprotein glucose dehydrogenase